MHRTHQEHLYHYLPAFGKLLEIQLQSDEARHGDTWLKLTRQGQEERIWADLERYMTAYRQHGDPIPWLKVAGLALIAWVRETRPDLFPQ